MGKCNKSDYNHTLYNLHRARVKSGDKQKNIIDHVILLKKKEKEEGKTRRLMMARFKADAKLKKFGITQAMINAVIERKGLTHLVK